MHSCIYFLLAIVASTRANIIPARVQESFAWSLRNNSASPLVSATTNFSLALLSDLDDLRNTPAPRTNSNKFFSPLGIAYMLAMMRLCSSGHTREEFNRLQIFQFHGNVSESFNTLHRYLMATSQRKIQGQVEVFKSLNLMCIEHSLEYTDTFYHRVRAFENVDGLLFNFSGKPQKSRMEINDMVREMTEGYIPNLLSPIDISSQTQLVISNTVFFKGFWKKRFTRAPRSMEYFHLADGSRIKTPMMVQTYVLSSHILCKTRNNLTSCRNSSTPDFVELPFRGDRRRMVIILPNARVRSLAEIKRRLPSEIDEWRDNADYNPISVSMPKFKLNYDVNLKEVLSARGLDNVFNTQTSDFRELTSQPLSFTKFIHKTSVAIGETGVTFAASSATIGVIRISTQLADDVLEVNRPFLFFIEDVPTKMMIFLGEVSNPK